MRKTSSYILAILISLAVLVIGLTSALWIQTKSQDKSNVITAACMDVSIINQEDIILLENQFPITDEEGLALTPYKFSIRNNCDRDVDYRLALESIGIETDSLSATNIKIAFDDKGAKLLSKYKSIDPILDNAYTAYQLEFETIPANTTEEHSLKIWIDEATTKEQGGKSYTSKVSLVFGQNVVKGEEEEEIGPFDEGTIAKSLIGAYGYSDPENILEYTDGFDKAPTTTSYNGLFKASVSADEASYYLRGVVSNNIVDFAGFLWNITRVNEDGSIRLALKGTTADNNACIIGTDKYNTDATKIGYYVNDNPIAITNTLNNWYQTNLSAKEEYLVSQNFCVDETSGTSEGSTSYYQANSRKTNFTPTLACNSSYVYNLKIGLLSMDEIMYAGSTAIDNTKVFLNCGKEYWTSTPASAKYGDITMFKSNTKNKVSTSVVTGSLGIRPVINLKVGTKFTNASLENIGTISNPYTVE